MLYLIANSKNILDNATLASYSELLKKCMKYLRKFNTTVNKLAYKYNKIPWLSLIFTENLLEVLLLTEDIHLKLEISSTLTLFLREEGVTPSCFHLINNSKSKEKIALMLLFFLKKENITVNKFYHFLDQDPFFTPLRTNIEQNFCKTKPEPCNFELNLEEYSPSDPKTLKILNFFDKNSKTPNIIGNPDKLTINLSLFDSDTSSIFSLLFQAFSSKESDNELSRDFYELLFILQLRKSKKNLPESFPVLISLLTFQFHQLYSKWNDITPFYKENKPELFTTNVYKDSFLFFQFPGITVLKKDKNLMKFLLEILGSFPSTGKLSEVFTNNTHSITEFLDYFLEKFFQNLDYPIEKFEKYHIVMLKKFRTLISNEILNLTNLTNKGLFDQSFNKLFFEVFNSKQNLMDIKNRKRLCHLNIFLEYLTTHVMGEEALKTQDFLSEIEKLYLRILETFLHEGPGFFLEKEDLSALYQSLLGIIIFIFNHSKPLFFEEVMYDFKLISRFEKKLQNCSKYPRLYLYFSHTILNNSLLNIFKRINLNEFVAQWDNPEIQSFMSLFQILTIQENLVIYRGVFINYGSILLKHVFPMFTSLDLMKEQPEKYDRLLLFVDVYLKDFILWTIHGYGDYLGFPPYLRLAFKERFIHLMKQIKTMAEADQISLDLIYKQLTCYKTIEEIPCHSSSFIHFISFKYREILIALNRLREHLTIDIENEVFFSGEEMLLFLEVNQTLQTPFSYNTSKTIVSNYSREFLFWNDKTQKTSQMILYLERVGETLVGFKDNMKIFFEKYANQTAFINVFNSDSNLYKTSNSFDVFLDYQRANHMLSFMIQQKDDDFIKLITAFNKTEILLGFYETSLRSYISVEEPEINENIYKLFENCIENLFDLYLFMNEKVTDEIATSLNKNYEKLLKKYEESDKSHEMQEKLKHKYIGLISFIQTKIFGKKYSRKFFKRFDLFNYISSSLKHINIFAKSKASKLLKQKLNDLLLFYYIQAKKTFLEKLSKENEPNDKKDFILYFIKLFFSFSELHRLSIHSTQIADSYKVSSFLNDNSSVFNVLTLLFDKISGILKKHELLFKWELDSEKKSDIRYFEDYFSFAFCKYFHCNLFNEFLFPSLQTEMLNIKENITMDPVLYEQKIDECFHFIKKYSQIWVLINKNEENIPDSLQKNYERYYTKDPLKVSNFITYGNKAIDFFLYLIYESHIRIKSNHIFLIIHTKLRAVPQAHKEKSVYVAFFARILEQHLLQICPSYKIESSRRFFQMIVENEDRLKELGLEFKPKKEVIDPIYCICLQALHINLIARLIQNTNDKEPNIPKGIDMIFDTWESRFEYVRYVNSTFAFVLEAKISSDDHFAVFEETIFRGKEFIGLLANGLSSLPEEKALELLEMTLFFIENYLKLPLSREKQNLSFLRIFNENKLDLSPILLILGVLSEKKEGESIKRASAMVLKFFSEVFKLSYVFNDNVKDFYHFQGLTTFMIFERMLWVSGSPEFRVATAGSLIEGSFFEKKENKFKENMSELDFANKNAQTFNNFGEAAWQSFLLLCEQTETQILLKNPTFSIFETFGLPSLSTLQKNILDLLLETFIENTLSYLSQTEEHCLLQKAQRKDLKKNNRFLLTNHYLFLQILTRLISKSPFLIPYILQYKGKSQLLEESAMGKRLQNEYKEIFEKEDKEIRFQDFLFLIYPFMNNAAFSFFYAVFLNQSLLIRDEKGSLFSVALMVKKEIVETLLKRLSLLSKEKEIFKNVYKVFQLYYVLSFLILVYKNENGDVLDRYLYEKTLESCFRILERAEEKEDFTLLNNMNVFFAMVYICLKKGQKLYWEERLDGKKFDKEAIK